ncbi:hypothetical protein BKA66DRAFT_454238 [Pyrenochaeta sp. MPI-SDFR-AT-0127]|nr:hypothetical protein BKA66DRAFT_454238 [Pyrenochaeta sp. MPI-SDFR-AT-0127]
MKLMDIPTELLDVILECAIVARGIARGLRLRLVCKDFAREVMRVMYNCRLFDTLYSPPYVERRYILPPFLQSYLEHRVKQEPSRGNPSLNLFRRLANDLHKDMDLNDPEPLKNDECLNRLCLVAMSSSHSTKRYNKIFQAKYNPDAADYRSHLFSAALCTSNLPIVRQCVAADASLLSQFRNHDENELFGSYIVLAAEYGSLNIIRYLLMSGMSNNDTASRADLFCHVAQAGRLENLHYIYDFKHTELPWTFEDQESKDAEALKSAFRTKSIGVMKFVEELRTVHSLPPIDSGTMQTDLYRCGRAGAREAAAHLLHLGAWINGPRSYEPAKVIINACAFPFADIAMIDFLLDHGANESGTIAAAALRGYTHKVVHLLDIVRLLLDAGVDVNESIGCESPLVSAISLEHTEMFRFLIERGANLRAPRTAEECVKRARKGGLESMVKLLEEHGVDVNSYQEVLD